MKCGGGKQLHAIMSLMKKGEKLISKLFHPRGCHHQHQFLPVLHIMNRVKVIHINDTLTHIS
jgi:hypothetical protein